MVFQVQEMLLNVIKANKNRHVFKTIGFKYNTLIPPKLTNGQQK